MLLLHGTENAHGKQRDRGKRNIPRLRVPNIAASRRDRIDPAARTVAAAEAPSPRRTLPHHGQVVAPPRGCLAARPTGNGDSGVGKHER